MTKNDRTRNFLKAVYFDHPLWTPARIGLLPGAWRRHDAGLDDVAAEFPQISPEHRPGNRLRPEVSGAPTLCINRRPTAGAVAA